VPAEDVFDYGQSEANAAVIATAAAIDAKEPFRETR
jgi:hypothetical protein